MKTTVAMPICLDGPQGPCRHYHEPTDAQIEAGAWFVCDAFPDGIPDAIVESEVYHTHPVKGDHGIRYEGR